MKWLCRWVPLTLLNDRLCGIMHSLWGCSEGSELRRSNIYFNWMKCLHKQRLPENLYFYLKYEPKFTFSQVEHQQGRGNTKFNQQKSQQVRIVKFMSTSSKPSDIDSFFSFPLLSRTRNKQHKYKKKNKIMPAQGLIPLSGQPIPYIKKPLNCDYGSIICGRRVTEMTEKWWRINNEVFEHAFKRR